jgi:maltooligosyltrehalose trehalohydrolase
MRLRVWAPDAGRVAAKVDDCVVDMARDTGGWWRLDRDLEAGTDYEFVVDDAAYPDPRSPWQPAGIDGPTRVVDHAAFAWRDRDWHGIHLPSAVIYELHVGTFTPEGTFDAAIGKLDHLVALGVTAIELMPVAEFSGDRGWGYDGVDLFAPHHAYGGPEGLKRLVDAAHRAGLGVVMDVVYNHLGPAGNYLARYGPYFTDRYATPWGEAINLDGRGSDEVRRFIVDNALMWLRDYHCDGLRLDAVHAIVDASATHLIEELATAVERLASSLGRPLFVIAESDLNDPRVVRGRDAGGYGADAQWSDDLHHALHSVLTGERTGYYADFGSLADVAKALTDVFVYDGRHSAYRGRRHGRPATGLAGDRFLGFLQNHDQVGNRAAGERSSALMSPGRLMIGAALVFTAPFVPMLFQGEEWAATTPFLYFTDHRDPALGRAVSEGRRAEFVAFSWAPERVPDPQDPVTFARSKLDWSELALDRHEAMLDWHRRLIRMRRDEPDLASGPRDAVGVRVDENAGWLVMERGAVSVAVNVSDRTVTVPVRAGTLLLASPGAELGLEEAKLGPDSVLITRCALGHS